MVDLLPKSGKDYIYRIHSPLIAVKSSADVDQIAARNNLPSFSHLLAPFGQRIGGKIHVRDAKGQAFYMENFSVRFRNLSQVEGFGQVPLNGALSAPVNFGTEEEPIKVDLAALREYGGIETREFELYGPNYLVYRDLICLHNGAVEHETFNHPVACFIVASTQQSDPLSVLSQLGSQVELPSVYESGYMDNSFLKHYLLIHDTRNCAPDTNADQLLQAMKRTFGLGCSLLVLNGKQEDEKQPPDLWRSSMESWNAISRTVADHHARIGSPTQPGPPGAVFNELFPPFGYLLGRDDFTKVDTVIKDFIVQSLLPHMEQHIQLWNDQIQSSRGGMTSRLFKAGMKFLGSSTKAQVATTTSVDSNGFLTYPCRSNEMTLRRLADFAFMLRDYQFAYERYDWLRKDFQGKTTSTKFYAGAQEMLGLCVLLTEGSSRGSIDGFLDAAVDSYRVSRAFTYETRVACLYFELLKHKKLYRDSPLVLNKMTGDESELRSGLFLEQSALCYLCCQPMLERKYAFFMVMAANRFTKCQQRVAAFRCFSQSLEIYQGRDWTLIEDHIYFALGREAIQLLDMIAGVNYLSKLMRSSKQSPRIQAGYVKDFLAAYGQLVTSGKPEDMARIEAIHIPEFQDKLTTVSLLRENNTDVGLMGNEEVWETMEKELFDSGFSKAKNRHFTHKKQDPHILTCAVGEPVYIHFEMQNPLHAPLTLKNLSIRCVYGNLPENIKDFVDEDRTNIILVEKDGFTVENEPDLILSPDEKRKFVMTLIPKLEGRIHILGAVYLVGGLIPSFHSFAKSVKMSKTADMRYPCLNVTPPMPVLDAVFHSIPETVVSGEVVRCALEITNKGNRGLKHLKIKLSHPQFFHFGSASDLEKEPYANVATSTHQEPITLPNKLVDVSLCHLKLPFSDGESLEGILPPEQTTLIPVFLRGDRMGKHQFKFVFGYRAEGNETATNYRALRKTVLCTVQPSLRINAFTRPSTRSLSEFTLGIEIENLQATAPVKLEQVSALSCKWKVIPIKNENLQHYGQDVFPKQTMYLYFKFIRIPFAVAHKDLPESQISRIIEKLVTSDANPTLSPGSIPIHYSSLSTGDSSVACSDEPFRELSFRSRAQWRTTSLQNQYGGMTADKVRQLFSLYYSDDVDLTLFWTIAASEGKPARKGHQYIMGINLGLQSPLQQVQSKFSGKNAEIFTSKALFQETVNEKKALIASLLKSKSKEISPLRIHIKAVEQVYHDFTSDLILPITLTLCNSSPHHIAHFTVELLSADPAATKNTPLVDFYWSGSTCCSGTLQPEEECDRVVHAAFPRAGVFDLNRWKLTVRTGSDPCPKQAVHEDPLEASAHRHRSGIHSYTQTPTLPHLITLWPDVKK